jgi:hypothetical protein
VEWFSYREEYLRSIGVFKDAVLAILACIAKQERVGLSERVQACRSRARSQGKFLGRPRAAVRPERVLRLGKGSTYSEDRYRNWRQRHDGAADRGCARLVNAVERGPPRLRIGLVESYICASGVYTGKCTALKPVS